MCIITHITSSHSRNILQSKDCDALHFAIKCLKYEPIEQLLEQQPSLMSTEIEGNTVIHTACEFPNAINILILLLKYVQQQGLTSLLTKLNNNQLTPLLFAIYHKNKYACQELIKQKANLSYSITNGTQVFHDIVNDSKLLFCEYKNELYIGYSFSQKNIHRILSPLNDLTNAVIHTNSTIQNVNNVNTKLIEATIIQPSSQLLQILLSQVSATLKNENLKTTIYIPAVRIGSIRVIDYLIQEKITVQDYFNIDNGSLLYESIKHRNEEVFIQLCEHVVNQRSASFQKVGGILLQIQSTHPLLLCIDLNKPKTFNYLLDEKFQFSLTFLKHQDNTIIHLILNSNNRNVFLRLFIERIQSNKLKPFLNNTPLVDCYTNNSKITPLHLCAQYFPECLSMILELNPDPTIADSSGNTALHLAVNADSLNSTKLILDQYKNTSGLSEMVNATNLMGLTPLHNAVDKASEDIVRLLLDNNANIYAINEDKRTVFHHSVFIKDRNKSVSIMKILLEYNSLNQQQSTDLVRGVDSERCTALHLAIKCQNLKAIEYLLKQQIDISITDCDENTILHLAVMVKYTGLVVKSILRAVFEGSLKNIHIISSTDFINMRNSQGKSALSLSMECADLNTIESILAYEPRLDSTDMDGNSPLHISVQFNSIKCLNTLLKKIKSRNSQGIMRFLNAVNNKGLSPLHHAIACNNYESAEILCNEGAQLSLTSPNGTITLCHGIDGLKLRFMCIRPGYFKEYQYYICYTRDTKNSIVIASLLPELSTKVFQDSAKLKLVTELPEHAIQFIIKCSCTEPLEALIASKFLDFSKDKTWDLYWKVADNSSMLVTNYLFQNYPDKMKCSKSLKTLEKAVIINDNTKIIENTLNKFPLLDKLDEQEIHSILKTVVELSISNDSTTNLKTLLARRAKLNYLYGDEKDRTILHIIAEKDKNIEFFTCILEEILTREEGEFRQSTFIDGKSMIDHQNNKGKTALHLCIQKKRHDLLRIILKHCQKIMLKDLNDNTIVHLAASTGDLLIAQEIFQKISTDEYPYYFESENIHGCTPLHLATSVGSKDICKNLLEKGASLFSIDKDERTMFHHAMLVENKENRLETLTFLLEEFPNKKDDRSKNLLRKQDRDGCTALHNAVEHQYESEVALLIKADSSVVELYDKNMHTLLHVAIAPEIGSPKLSIPNESIFVKVFEILNLKPRAYGTHQHAVICQQDIQGRTALHLSIAFNNIFALEKILSVNPCLLICDEGGNSIFHKAVKKADDQALRTIIRHINTDDETLGRLDHSDRSST
ncbi:Ankyrin repeat protein [Oopsacas minuta]|uniref:Ankyrin repeat protein n=1 Tax=Oopsacas minuta TaxID=111878 RepID=A0AAV7KCX8_9METZ|nr:Ankyrin repeat protein [Oopsacas minuta]